MLVTLKTSDLNFLSIMIKKMKPGYNVKCGHIEKIISAN